MLCVSISDQDLEQCRQQVLAYPFVELRLDKIKAIQEERFKLYQGTKCFIATCRPEGVSQEESFIRLIEAICNGAQYVDVEIEKTTDYIAVIKEFADRYACQLMLSYHNYDDTPSLDFLRRIYDKALLLRADLVKIACQTDSEESMNRLLEFQAGKAKLVALGMGLYAEQSRRHSLNLNAPFTYVAPDQGKLSAPGQPRFTSFASTLKAKQNISLIGFMGSGKSSVGRQLAPQMELEFIDLDAQIECDAGLSITEIFSMYGETYFRLIESRMLRSTLLNGGAIIACGGGAIEKVGNNQILARLSKCIWLDSSFEVCMRRIKNSNNRPLFANNHSRKLKEIYQRRQLKYKEASRLRILADNKTVSEICKIIQNDIN